MVKSSNLFFYYFIQNIPFINFPFQQWPNMSNTINGFPTISIRLEGMPPIINQLEIGPLNLGIWPLFFFGHHIATNYTWWILIFVIKFELMWYHLFN